MDKEFKQIYQNLLELSQKLKAPAIHTNILNATTHPTAIGAIPSLFPIVPAIKVEKLVAEFEKLLDLCRSDPFQGTHLLYQAIPTLFSLIFNNREKSWIANCYDEGDKGSLFNLLDIEGSLFNALKSISKENIELKFQVELEKLPACLIESLSNPQTPDSFLAQILSNFQSPNSNTSLRFNSLQFFLLSFLICVYNFKQQTITPLAEKFALKLITNLSSSYCHLFLPYEAPSAELKLTCEFFNALINHLFLLPNIDATTEDPLPPSEYFPSIVPNDKLPHISHIKLLQQLPRYIAHPSSYSIKTLSNLINFIKTVILHWPNCEQYYSVIGIFQFAMFPWRVDNATVSLEECEDYIHQFFVLYTDLFRLYLNRSRHLPLGTKSATELETKLVNSFTSTIDEYLYNEFYASLFAIESELIENGDKTFSPCYTIETPDEIKKLIIQLEYNIHHYKFVPLISMQSPQSIPTLSKENLEHTAQDVKTIFSIDLDKTFYEPKELEFDINNNLGPNDFGGRNMYVFWTNINPVFNDEQRHIELGTLVDQLDTSIHNFNPFKNVFNRCFKFVFESCLPGEKFNRYRNYWELRWINLILLLVLTIIQFIL